MAGRWAVSLDTFLSPNEQSFYYATPTVNFNICENSSVGLGYMSFMENNETDTYWSAKYTYYWGRESFKPHATLGYLARTMDDKPDQVLTEYAITYLRFGSCYDISDDLSLEFDVFSLEVDNNVTVKPVADRGNDYTNAFYFSFLPSFNLRYTF